MCFCQRPVIETYLAMKVIGFIAVSKLDLEKTAVLHFVRAIGERLLSNADITYELHQL